MDCEIGVGVGIIVKKEDEILLLKRNTTHGNGTWTPPGGTLEYGESFEECAIRECKEETNVDIDEVRFITLTNDIFEEEKEHYVTIWMEGRYASGESKVNSKGEVSEIKWVTWDKLPKNLFLSFQNLIKGNIFQ